MAFTLMNDDNLDNLLSSNWIGCSNNVTCNNRCFGCGGGVAAEKLPGEVVEHGGALQTMSKTLTSKG